MVYCSPPLTDREFEKFFGYAPRKFIPRKSQARTSNNLADADPKSDTPILIP